MRPVPTLPRTTPAQISRRNAFKPGYQILLRAGRKTWTCEAVSSRRSAQYTTLSTETARITSHSVGGGRSPQVLRVEATASQPGCPTGRVIKRRRRIAIVGTLISHLQRSGGCVGQTDGRSLARVEFEVVGRRIHVDIQHGVPPSAPTGIGGFSLRNPEDAVSISRRIGPPSPATIPALSLRNAKIRDRQADSQSQDLHSRYLVAACSSKQAPAWGQHRFRTYCFRAGLTGAWASYRVSRPDRHIDPGGRQQPDSLGWN